jgi:hypothetical protein
MVVVIALFAAKMRPRVIGRARRRLMDVIYLAGSALSRGVICRPSSGVVWVRGWAKPKGSALVERAADPGLAQGEGAWVRVLRYPPETDLTPKGC